MYRNMEQILSDFNGEWIFMANCKESSCGKVIGGEVLVHTPDRDVLFKEIAKYDNESGTYIRYVGNPPGEVNIVL